MLNRRLLYLILDYLNHLNTVVVRFSAADDIAKMHINLLASWDKFMCELEYVSTAECKSDARRAMIYALAAYTDERVLSVAHQKSLDWAHHALQKKIFNIDTAGVGFFDYLKIHMQQSQYDVIQVYYLCLRMGFQGKYMTTSDALNPHESDKQKLLCISDESSVENSSPLENLIQQIKLRLHVAGVCWVRDRRFRVKKKTLYIAAAVLLFWLVGCGFMQHERDKVSIGLYKYLQHAVYMSMK